MVRRCRQREHRDREGDEGGVRHRFHRHLRYAPTNVRPAGATRTANKSETKRGDSENGVSIGSRVREVKTALAEFGESIQDSNSLMRCISASVGMRAAWACP